MVLAVVLSVAATSCYVDHVAPMNTAMDHSHAMSSGCIPDLCVTITSKDSSLVGNSVESVAWLSALLLAGLAAHLAAPDSRHGTRLAVATRLPGSPRKLYQLHAVYRL